MSILVVDIGNSRVKWARVQHGRLQQQRAAVHQGWRAKDFAKHVMGHARGVERVIVASVAGARLEGQLTAAARRMTGREPEFITARRRLGGVRTAYSEPWRFGIDRFVAAIGAHNLSPHRAVCVIDVGTAVTIDLVDAHGRHLGGAITPGPCLMIESLLSNTSGIRRRSVGQIRSRILFARDTRAAIELGARFAVAAVIDRAVKEARAHLGRSPLVLLTGGAARHVEPLIRSAHSNIPDLVLRGLAALI
jgi:type III pantothenate kinase